MSNQWVISWLVIDYWWWSISNRGVIEGQKFCGPSITHRWHWLLINDPLITHWWPIDYSSSIILHTNNTFLAYLYHFFLFVILLSVLDAFFLLLQHVSITWGYWTICKTEQPWRGNRQGTYGLTTNGKEILENLLKLHFYVLLMLNRINLEASVNI